MLAYKNLLSGPVSWVWSKGKSALAWGGAITGGLIANEAIGNPVGNSIWNPVDRVRQGFSNMEGRGDANYQYTQAFAGGFKLNQIFAGLMTAVAAIVLKFSPDNQWAKNAFTTWSKAGSTRVDEKGRIVEGNESIEQTGKAGNIALTALLAGATGGAGYAVSKYLKRGSNGGDTPPDGNTPPKGPNGPANGSPEARSTSLSESERIQADMEAERVKAANAGKTADTDTKGTKPEAKADASQHGGQAGSKKAASGAAIETAENAVKHSRGGKLGMIATAVGVTGVATSVYATQGNTAELDQPTTAPAVPKLSTGENLMLGAMTADAAYGVSKGASLVAGEGLKFAGKRLPIVGGGLTMVFTTMAAAGYALKGEFGRAGAELATGTVEAALNTTGLGLLGAGDAAREALRAGIGTVAGEGYTPDKSGLRSVIEYATGTGDFNAVATQTASVGELKDAVANSEIRTAEVSLDGLSGDFTSSAMMPVPAPSSGGIDLGSMDNKNRKSRHPSPNATIG